MTDSWEDWENEDFDVVVLNIPTQEQLKRLEEQKLVEESDNVLASDLFNNDIKKQDLTYEQLKQSEPIKNIQLPANKNKPSKKTDKQKENEQKQKELSKKLKEEKARREKERELFGYAEYDDEYADYEDKYC